MTVSELSSKLVDLVMNGELKGNEPVFDAAFFNIDGFDIIKPVNGDPYVILVSREYARAQELESLRDNWEAKNANV